MLHKLLCTTAIIAALSLPASAETLVGTHTRQANDNGTNTHFFKQLNDAGSTTLPFVTATNHDLVIITYNAECAVLGPSESWLSVTILVDGVQANPQNGTDFALCTAASPTAFQWVGAVRQSVFVVPFAGTHNVQVLVDLNNGATTWWLGDTSLVVEAK